MALNLGTLLFGLGVDTTGLVAAERAVSAFGRTVQGAQVAANRGFDTSIQMLRRQENTLLAGLERLRSMQDQINKSSLAPQVKLDTLRQANDLYAQLAQRVTSGAKGLDPTKIDRASFAFRGAANDLIKGMQAGDRAAKQVVTTIERQEAALHRASEAAKSLNASIQRSKAPGLGGDASPERIAMMGRVDTATSLFRTQMAGGGTAQQAAQWRRQWETSINSVKRDLATLNMKAPSTAGWMKFNETLHSLGAASLFVNGHLGGMSTRMFALSSLVRENGLVFGVAAGAVAGFGAILFGLGKSTVTTRLQLEKMTNALTAIEGNSAAAGAALNYVREVSDKAGLSLGAVSQSYMRLIASGKAAGMTTDSIRNIFETFSMASGTLALSVEDTQGVFRALDQIMSKGTVQAEELRGQLGDRLPGAFAIAADSMGVTTAQLNKMMKQGKVLSSDFLPKFTEQVKTAFGLDMSGRVETLQASMGRLSNSWLFFNSTLDASFGITNAYKNALGALTGVLNYLAENMTTVVGVVGALGGALGALAAAAAMPLILSAIAAGAAALGGVFAALTAGTLTLASAQTALAAAFAATPWGAVGALALRLGAIMLGAKVGFDLASKAANSLNVALGENRQIENYIAQQKRLGWQVRSTTLDMMKQMIVAGRAAMIEGEEAVARVNRAKGKVGFYAQTVAPPTTIGGIIQNASSMLLTRAARKELGEAQENAREVAARMRRISSNMRGLGTISHLPSEVANPSAALDAGDPKKDKGSDKAANEAERAADAVQKLLDALKLAQEGLRRLFSGDGLPDFRAVDAFMAAREQIQGMNENELNAMKAKMNMAGASTDDLVDALASLIGKTNLAKEAASKFRDIWEGIDNDLKARKGLQTTIDFLQKGGSADDLWVVEAVNKAYDEIARLAELGPSGQVAIEGLRQKLALLGYTANTTAEALAKFYQDQERMNRQIKSLQDVQKAWEDIGKATNDASLLLQAYARGDNVGAAMERLLAMRDKIADFRKSMTDIYGAGSYVEEQVTAYANSLAALDQVNERLERTKQAMGDLKGIWTDTFRGMFDAILAVADGTKSLGDAITELAMNVANQFADKAVDFLANASWDALMGGNPMAAAAGLVGGNKGGGAAAAANSAAARSVTTLAVAADAAAQALLRIAAQAGLGAGAAGGGSGILGALLNVGLAAAGGASGGGFMGADNTLYVDDVSFFPTRAAGGRVTKGLGYRVNEQGTNGEIFFPDTSGTIANASQLGQSRGTTIYDQRTTIDARGATPDAVDALRMEMRAREQRLRQQLPFEIDSRVRDSKQRLRFG